MTATAGIVSGVTGCILAGGRGSRLGGRDKGLVEIAGRPLIAHVAARLAPQVASVLISANRHPESYRAYADLVVADATGDYRGPLAGIAAALDRCPTEFMVCVPCDSPFLPRDLVARLTAARDAAGTDVAVVTTGERLQPVFALVARALRDDLEAWLANGERKIDRWYARHAPALAHYPAEDGAFMNVNTPQELAQAAALLEPA